MHSSSLKHRIAQQETQINTEHTQGELNNPQLHEERQEIVLFAEEGDVNKGGHSSSEFLTISKDAHDQLANSIIGFLQRPILLGQFDWKATDLKLSRLFSLNLPEDWITEEMIGPKLLGFRFLRCDLKIRVQVNAQQFNAGRLLLVYLPLSQQQAYAVSNSQHLGGLTGYPRVDLDLATSTSAELTIPYSTVLSHFDMVRTNGTFGTVAVVVYSELTGLAEVDATVWTYATNVDLQLPTPIQNDTPIGYAQMDNEKKRPGNVETIANSVSKIATKLGKIPLIGSFVEPAGGIADMVSGVASIFGWSKPTDPEFATVVTQTYGKHMTNYNGDSKAKSLALDARNAITVESSMFASGEDEMALSSILSKPTYLCSFKMLKTDLRNKVLIKIPVTPSYCLTRETEVGTTKFVQELNTRLSYNSNLFKYWRGTIRYHFKVVKTPFHSARIRVAFLPGATAGHDISLIDYNQAYSKIVDLRETNEFDVEIPYLNNQPWEIAHFSNNIRLETGLLVVTVLNSLKNPSTCADQVEFIVETSAGEDFQFAFPTIRTEDVKIFPKDTIATGYAQFDTDFIPKQKPPHTNPNQLGIGEVVTSYRQVLKRYNTDKFYKTLANDYLIIPGRTHVWEEDPTIETMENQQARYIDFVESQFRFQTGSRRVAVLANQPGAATSRIFQLGITGEGSSHGAPINVQATDSEPFVEFHLPFYQRWPMLPTSVGAPRINDAGINHALANYSEVPFNHGTYLQTKTDLTSDTIFSSIGEDFSFGFLIGPPITGFLEAVPPP